MEISPVFNYSSKIYQLEITSGTMIIYSVTVSIDPSVEEDWKYWMQKVHIPEVMATGFFVRSHFHKLLEPVPDPRLATYNIQYECESKSEYNRYMSQAAPALQAAHVARYKDKFVAFRTLLYRESSF
jgi:hypothetical protein